MLYMEELRDDIKVTLHKNKKYTTHVSKKLTSILNVKILVNPLSTLNVKKITLRAIFLHEHLIEKGRDLTQSYDKSPYTNRNVKKGKVTHKQRHKKVRLNSGCGPT